MMSKRNNSNNDNIFETKDLAPMLIGKNQAAFSSDEYIFELKLDGIRCIAYLCDEGLTLRNKRNKHLNAIYPELANIYTQAKARCILDGELVVLKDGRTNFFEVQKRSLMANPMKIKLAAQKLPASFVAYDILFLGDELVTSMPLMKRKELLQETITESDRLALTRFISTNGEALYKAAADKGLEGIIAKRKDSKYYFGKRTKDWIKIKAMMDEDFVVCGYYAKGGNTASIIIGVYAESNTRHEIIYQGHVMLGLSRFDYQAIQSASQVSKDDFYKQFPDFEDAIWITPELVCTVEYMERTPHGGLRQPVFKGLRDDKVAKECVI